MSNKKERVNNSQPKSSGNSFKKRSKRSIVATLLYIEAAIVLALALWLIVFSFTHENVEVTPVLGEIGFALLGSAGLYVAGRGYARGKNYGRSPAVLANLIALGVAYYQIQGAFYIGAAIIMTTIFLDILMKRRRRAKG